MYLRGCELTKLLPNAWPGSALSFYMVITPASERAPFIPTGISQSATEVGYGLVYWAFEKRLLTIYLTYFSGIETSVKDSSVSSAG